MLRTFNAASVINDRPIVIIGGCDEAIDRDELSRWMSKNPDALFCHINNHYWRRNDKTIPIDILYHTTQCTDGDLTSEQLARVNVFSMFNIAGMEISEAHPAWRLMHWSDVNDNKHNCGVFANGRWAGVCPFGIEVDDVNQVNNLYDTKLFTGSIALFDLVYNIKAGKVFVTGMDLFGDRSGYQKKSRVESHDLLGNIEFLRNTIGHVGITLSYRLTRSLERYEA